jgi:hypothetical protein
MHFKQHTFKERQRCCLKLETQKLVNYFWSKWNLPGQKPKRVDVDDNDDDDGNEAYILHITIPMHLI